MTTHATPNSGEVISLRNLRAMAHDGTRLRYALMELAAQIPDAIALGRGDPDLNTPGHVIAAARQAVEDGRADVPAPSAGLPELREAIARKLREENGIPVDASGVLITSGGQEALYLLIQALLDPGDEILVPDPRYTSYDQAIKQAGARMVLVPTYPEDNFDLRPAEVEARITSKTKALLLVSPNNPTAGIISPANLRAIAEIARRHDLVVVSDEIYEKLVYPPGEHLSIASLPGMFERTVTLNGVSKTYAMTGWRIGYLAAPPEVIEALTVLKQVISGRTASVSQYAALAAITGPQDIVQEYHAIYTRRRQILLDGLHSLGFTYGEPLGGFYVYTNAASTGLSAFELSYLLLKEGHVLIFPGTAFGERWSDWLRISWLQPEDVLQEALDRMATVLAQHREPLNPVGTAGE
ncbi:MAG: pyridoxal phosphate-dependent aminotransferase [Ardenticatenaceae bacterium]|nr:pyridoxal phosphate-dependent aminotransferase [Ardenticatenaceae bacterium]